MLQKYTKMPKNENPDLPILAGGVHVTNAPEIFLKEIPEVDETSVKYHEKKFKIN